MTSVRRRSGPRLVRDEDSNPRSLPGEREKATEEGCRITPMAGIQRSALAFLLAAAKGGDGRSEGARDTRIPRRLVLCYS
jgi:hypothetical protein